MQEYRYFMRIKNVIETKIHNEIIVSLFKKGQINPIALLRLFKQKLFLCKTQFQGNKTLYKTLVNVVENNFKIIQIKFKFTFKKY